MLALLELQNEEIAARLHLSSGTVRNYITMIYDKLGIRSRNAVIKWAREHGLIGPE